MKRPFPAIIATSLVALVSIAIAGCAGASVPQDSVVSSAAVEVEPAGAYSSVEDLAAGLTRAGIQCTVTQVTEGASDSEHGSCLLPAREGDDIPVDITVWQSIESAREGIGAILEHADLIADMSVSGREYYVAGPTWILELRQYGVAAGTIVSEFGGRLLRAGED